MKIINLMENTCNIQRLESEHGLSFYIETKRHKILFDTGAGEAFAKNANVLKVDLSKVDTMILSHGHYDHAGGIMTFANLNNIAQIYIKDSAFGNYYSYSNGEHHYIGVDDKVKKLENIKLVTENIKIDDELFLLTNVKGRIKWPSTNLSLKEEINGNLVQDEFLHEQSLVINQNGKSYLLAGCSHNGVVNILQEYFNIFGKYPDVYIGGFHLQKQEDFTDNDVKLVNDIADDLLKTETKFYTCHCTGQTAYDILKSRMLEKVQYISTGESIES